MPRLFKFFNSKIRRKQVWTKLFQNQDPGARILPVKAGENDKKYQVRLDAGETRDGKKTIYLQVNAEAEHGALKRFLAKKGTHANLAVGEIDMNTPPEKQEEAAAEFWAEISQQAKENLP